MDLVRPLLLEMMHDLTQRIRTARVPLETERAAHDGLETILRAHAAAKGERTWGIEREVWIGTRKRIDLVVGRVGIEIKVKGGRAAIVRQCEGYCQSDDIDGLILAANRSVALPEEINGKPVMVASLGRGWL